tara:strand:- start:1035 stop:1259 length:225 start_codon:yes stop_codon:yes gene_type:complete
MIVYPFPPGTPVHLPDGTPLTIVTGEENARYLYWKGDPGYEFTPVLNKHGNMEVYLPSSLLPNIPPRIKNARIP